MLRLSLTAAAIWLGLGTAYAQIGGSGISSPPEFGMGSPPVGGSGIPMGATGLTDPGLSPLPGLSLGPTTGNAPMPGFGTGGMVTPGLSGSSMGPASSSAAPSPPVGADMAPQNTVTNYGFAGMQRPPGSPPVFGAAIR